MTKPKDKKKVTAQKTEMCPTKERSRQNGGVMMEAIANGADSLDMINRYRAVWECPLDAYKDFRVITEGEHQAGLRFRNAYYHAVLSRRAGYERLNNYPTSMNLNMSERILRDAQRIVAPHNMGTVIDVCGYDRVVWNEKALEKLRKGLGNLALHWHMMAIEVCEHKKK